MSSSGFSRLAWFSGLSLLLSWASPGALAAVAAAASPAPPDIRDRVDLEPFYLSGHYWLLLLALGCVAWAAFIGWLLWRASKNPKIVIPPGPHEVARERLEALRSRADDLDPRAFGEEAADILRAFIGSQHGLHAQRQTSPEFLDSVRGSTLFATTQHTVLADFLTQCDLLKFARQDATREGKLKLIDQAALFLDTDSRPPPEFLPRLQPPVLKGPILQPPPLPTVRERYPYESPDSRYMPPT